MDRIKKSSYEFPERLGDIDKFDESKTQQSFADEVDINTIVARALKTGLLGDPSSIASRQAIFGDFSEIGSYQESLNKVIAAQNAFNELPADVRSRFNNDPGKLMEFIADDKNRPEAESLGLVVKKEVTAPLGAEVTPPAGNATPSA